MQFNLKKINLVILTTFIGYILVLSPFIKKISGIRNYQLLFMIICLLGIILLFLFWKRKSRSAKTQSIAIIFIGIVIVIRYLHAFYIYNPKLDYVKIKELQDRSVPLFIDTFQNKTALFIFPHIDDEIFTAGAILELKKCNWTINLVTLTRGQLNEKTTRLEEGKKTSAIFKIDNREFYDLPNNSWENVIKNDIIFWNDHKDSIENIVYNSIQKYNPSLIFTYDTALGSYGHPEHRILAIAVTKVFNNHKNESLFSANKLLQLTIPQNLAKLLYGKNLSYKNAIKYTGNKTLPDPTISFEIEKHWPTIRKAALANASQSISLPLFLPKPKDTTIHYRSFSREYYYELK